MRRKEAPLVVRGKGASVPRETLLTPFEVTNLIHGTSVHPKPSAVDSTRVPDIIEFVMSPQFLDKPLLYPRQGTILKVATLRDDLLTDFDLDLIGQWEDVYRQTGNEGISPGVLDRIRINKEAGRSWFREIDAPIGRRGGKGHIGGLLGAYVLWNYMHRPGGPQEYYGIDRDKRLSAIVFAGKKEQAIANQWRDLTNTVASGPCFAPYISRHLGSIMTVLAPTDMLRMQKQQLSGVDTENDPATFEILPSSSTLMAGRGPASFMQHFDEMAHIIATGSNRDAEAIYSCLHPDTRVLTADLDWKRIEDLVEGESLVAVDEHGSGQTGSPRKMREAQVLHKWDTFGPTYRMTFDDGTSVVCSGTHRWLRSKCGKNWRWGAIEKPKINKGEGNPTNIKVGDHIRRLVDVWEQEQTYESGYLAGAYDGEGHIGFANRGSMTIWFSQNPGQVMDRVQELLDDRGFSPDRRRAGSNSNCDVLTVRGYDNVFRLLGTLNPLRMRTNARHLWQDRAFRGGGSKRVVSIERLEDQRLIDMETTTGTFIAEGLVSHNSATPSLDQFGVDGFIFAGSSPWHMQGQFYKNCQQATQMDEDGTPSYPEMLMVQLPSWGPYEDYERAETIPLVPGKAVAIDLKPSVKGTKAVVSRSTQSVRTYSYIKRPIQVYDDQMRQLERANPETFKVERRSHWSEALDAYLNPDRVRAAFVGPDGNPMRMTQRGPLTNYYAAHGDPAKVGDNFGFAIAHTEPGDESTYGLPYVVFDVLHAWRPNDFEDNSIDYGVVQTGIERYIERFTIEHLTFDQWNSVFVIGRLNEYVRDHGFTKSISIYERTATAQSNWREAETFKAALNMGLIRAPLLDEDGKESEAAELAELELRFLHECYDDQTEVLTEHGWMLFRDVPEGAKVATRSDEGGLEWQTPIGRTDKPYSGELRTYLSNSVNFAVTPNHRMLVDSASPQHRGNPYIVQAGDLNLGRYSVPLVAHADRSGDDGLMMEFGREWPTSVVRGERFYSEDEDKLLRDYYARVPSKHLSVLMGRSEASVGVRARKMGLRKEVRWGTPMLSAPVEDFAAFCGMWLADGTKARPAGHGVELSQKKPEGIAWIDALMQRLGWKHRRTETASHGVVWSFSSRDLKDYLMGLYGPEGLRLPQAAFDEWGPVARQRLLEGLLSGDGCADHRDSRGKVGFIAEHKSLADDVHRLLSVMGVGARTIRLPRERPDADMWFVRMKVHSHGALETARISDVPYEGRVYCLTVPNGTLLVRRGGVSMWCGNSNGRVDHQTSGPVQTKDISDSMMATTYHLIGSQMGEYLKKALGTPMLGMSAQGGMNSPETRSGGRNGSGDAIQRMSQATRRGGGMGAPRGMARRRR